MTGRVRLPYTVRVVGKFAATLAFLLLLVPARVALAEHEIQYRYTVLGYVKDARGQPEAGVPIELTRQKTGFSYLGETDASGLYVIVARLADESLGERLTLRAGTREISIIVRFNPGERSRERGTHVDFLGSKGIELPSSFPLTLKRFLAH